MKKAIKILSFALVLVLCTLMFASCGAPNSDPNDALAALKDNDYKAAIKDSTVTPTILAGLGISDVDCVVSASGIKDKKFESVTIVYFESSEDANDAWEKMQKYAEDEKDDDAEDWVCKKSGKMIYFGTPNAIKAAK